MKTYLKFLLQILHSLIGRLFSVTGLSGLKRLPSLFYKNIGEGIAKGRISLVSMAKPTTVSDTLFNIHKSHFYLASVFFLLKMNKQFHQRLVRRIDRQKFVKKKYDIKGTLNLDDAEKIGSSSYSLSWDEETDSGYRDMAYFRYNGGVIFSAAMYGLVEFVLTLFLILKIGEFFLGVSFFKIINSFNENFLHYHYLHVIGYAKLTILIYVSFVVFYVLLSFWLWGLELLDDNTLDSPPEQAWFVNTFLTEIHSIVLFVAFIMFVGATYHNFLLIITVLLNPLDDIFYAIFSSLFFFLKNYSDYILVFDLRLTFDYFFGDHHLVREGKTLIPVFSDKFPFYRTNSFYLLNNNPFVVHRKINNLYTLYDVLYYSRLEVEDFEMKELKRVELLQDIRKFNYLVSLEEQFDFIKQLASRRLRSDLLLVDNSILLEQYKKINNNSCDKNYYLNSTSDFSYLPGRRTFGTKLKRLGHSISFTDKIMDYKRLYINPFGVGGINRDEDFESMGKFFNYRSKLHFKTQPIIMNSATGAPESSVEAALIPNEYFKPIGVSNRFTKFFRFLESEGLSYEAFYLNNYGTYSHYLYTDFISKNLSSNNNPTDFQNCHFSSYMDMEYQINSVSMLQDVTWNRMLHKYFNPTFATPEFKPVLTTINASFFSSDEDAESTVINQLVLLDNPRRTSKPRHAQLLYSLDWNFIKDLWLEYPRQHYRSIYRKLWDYTSNPIRRTNRFNRFGLKVLAKDFQACLLFDRRVNATSSFLKNLLLYKVENLITIYDKNLASLKREQTINSINNNRTDKINFSQKKMATFIDSYFNYKKDCFIGLKPLKPINTELIDHYNYNLFDNIINKEYEDFLDYFADILIWYFYSTKSNYFIPPNSTCEFSEKKFNFTFKPYLNYTTEFPRLLMIRFWSNIGSYFEKDRFNKAIPINYLKPEVVKDLNFIDYSKLYFDDDPRVVLAEMNKDQLYSFIKKTYMYATSFFPTVNNIFWFLSLNFESFYLTRRYDIKNYGADERFLEEMRDLGKTVIGPRRPILIYDNGFQDLRSFNGGKAWKRSVFVYNSIQFIVRASYMIWGKFFSSPLHFWMDELVAESEFPPRYKEDPEIAGYQRAWFTTYRWPEGNDPIIWWQRVAGQAHGYGWSVNVSKYKSEWWFKGEWDLPPPPYGDGTNYDPPDTGGDISDMPYDNLMGRGGCRFNEYNHFYVWRIYALTYFIEKVIPILELTTVLLLINSLFGSFFYDVFFNYFLEHIDDYFYSIFPEQFYEDFFLPGNEETIRRFNSVTRKDNEFNNIDFSFQNKVIDSETYMKRVRNDYNRFLNVLLEVSEVDSDKGDFYFWKFDNTKVYSYNPSKPYYKLSKYAKDEKYVKHFTNIIARDTRRRMQVWIGIPEQNKLNISKKNNLLSKELKNYFDNFYFKHPPSQHIKSSRSNQDFIPKILFGRFLNVHFKILTTGDLHESRVLFFDTFFFDSPNSYWKYINEAFKSSPGLKDVGVEISDEKFLISDENIISDSFFDKFFYDNSNLMFLNVSETVPLYLWSNVEESSFNKLIPTNFSSSVFTYQNVLVPSLTKNDLELCKHFVYDKDFSNTNNEMSDVIFRLVYRNKKPFCKAFHLLNFLHIKNASYETNQENFDMTLNTRFLNKYVGAGDMKEITKKRKKKLYGHDQLTLRKFRKRSFNRMIRRLIRPFLIENYINNRPSKYESEVFEIGGSYKKRLKKVTFLKNKRFLYKDLFRIFYQTFKTRSSGKIDYKIFVKSKFRLKIFEFKPLFFTNRYNLDIFELIKKNLKRYDRYKFVLYHKNISSYKETFYYTRLYKTLLNDPMLSKNISLFLKNSNITDILLEEQEVKNLESLGYKQFGRRNIFKKKLLIRKTRLGLYRIIDDRTFGKETINDRFLLKRMYGIKVQGVNKNIIESTLFINTPFSRILQIGFSHANDLEITKSSKMIKKLDFEFFKVYNFLQENYIEIRLPFIMKDGSFLLKYNKKWLAEDSWVTKRPKKYGFRIFKAFRTYIDPPTAKKRYKHRSYYLLSKWKAFKSIQYQFSVLQSARKPLKKGWKNRGFALMDLEFIKRRTHGKHGSHAHKVKNQPFFQHIKKRHSFNRWNIQVMYIRPSPGYLIARNNQIRLNKLTTYLNFLNNLSQPINRRPTSVFWKQFLTKKNRFFFLYNTSDKNKPQLDLTKSLNIKGLGKVLIFQSNDDLKFINFSTSDSNLELRSYNRLRLISNGLKTDHRPLTKMLGLFSLNDSYNRFRYNDFFDNVLFNSSFELNSDLTRIHFLKGLRFFFEFLINLGLSGKRFTSLEHFLNKDVYFGYLADLDENWCLNYYKKVKFSNRDVYSFNLNTFLKAKKNNLLIKKNFYFNDSILFNYNLSQKDHLFSDKFCNASVHLVNSKNLVNSYSNFFSNYLNSKIDNSDLKVDYLSNSLRYKKQFKFLSRIIALKNGRINHLNFYTPEEYILYKKQKRQEWKRIHRFRSVKWFYATRSKNSTGYECNFEEINLKLRLGPFSNSDKKYVRENTTKEMYYNKNVRKRWLEFSNSKRMGQGFIKYFINSFNYNYLEVSDETDNFEKLKGVNSRELMKYFNDWGDVETQNTDVQTYMDYREDLKFMPPILFLKREKLFYYPFKHSRWYYSNYFASFPATREELNFYLNHGEEYMKIIYLSLEVMKTKIEYDIFELKKDIHIYDLLYRQDLLEHLTNINIRTTWYLNNETFFDKLKFDLNLLSFKIKYCWKNFPDFNFINLEEYGYYLNLFANFFTKIFLFYEFFIVDGSLFSYRSPGKVSGFKIFNYSWVQEHQKFFNFIFRILFTTHLIIFFYPYWIIGFIIFYKKYYEVGIAQAWTPSIIKSKSFLKAAIEYKAPTTKWGKMKAASREYFPEFLTRAYRMDKFSYFFRKYIEPYMEWPEEAPVHTKPARGTGLLPNRLIYGGYSYYKPLTFPELFYYATKIYIEFLVILGISAFISFCFFSYYWI